MMTKRNFKVYRFRDINNTILYVGYTAREVHQRFLEHCKDKYWINQVASIEACNIENESQARLNETYYINIHKPIFNLKDKFSGKIYTKLRKKDEKFNHSFFYAHDKVTPCVPKTNNNYTLVEIIEYNDKHIGMYYDQWLNVYYSATEIAEVLGMKNKRLITQIAGNDNFFKDSYSVYKNGSQITKNIYMCNYHGLQFILSKNKHEEELKLAIDKAYACINDIQQQDIINIKSRIDRELQGLSKEEYANPSIKRRIIYKALTLSNSTEQIYSKVRNLVTINNKRYFEYKKRYNTEVLASDIFSMIEDLENEFCVSYTDVYRNFIEFLNKDNHKTFELYRARVQNTINHKAPLHYVIAYGHERLYPIFLRFYNNLINSVA